MSVTKRFIVIAAIGILVIPFSGDYAALFFIAYNSVCFGLLVADFFLSPGPATTIIDITRFPDEKLSFKAMNTISFNVRNNYSRTLTLTLKDEPCDFHFELHPNNLTKSVPPSESAVFSYETFPAKRGAFVFPRIHIMLNSRLGLCRKYSSRPLPMEFKVYPNLKDLSKYRLLMLKNLRLENGKRIINMRGSGQEFESLRDYTEGDDFRRINWNASARTGKHIVNQYESEKNQPVFIMIDTGRPMSYMLKGYKKLDYAINAALILSDIVNQKGDNSGLCIFGATVLSFIKPGKGPAHRNNVMEALYHIEDTRNTSFYHAVFKDFAARQKRRSIIFLFTDFETDVELNDLVEQLRLLRKRHLPVVCLMKNDSVIKMSLNKNEDAKSLFEKSVAEDYLYTRERFIRSLNTSGIACIETDSENFSIDAVNHYLKLKARGI